MNKLFILGIALAMVLSAGTAMAAGDQTTEMFQTLGQMQTVETTAITQMTVTDLNAVEGKMSKHRGFKKSHRGFKKGGVKLNLRVNINKTDQYNVCSFCSAFGGKGGGGNITQINDNLTTQN